MARMIMAKLEGIIYEHEYFSHGGVASMYAGSWFDRWCHGPECHTKVTTDRVRGSKGSKVLRTRKVKQHKQHLV